MQAMKTIRCKIWKATRAKQAALEGEYDNLQLYLQTGVDDGLYSANKQQADRYFKKIKRGKHESKIVKKKSGFYIHITIHKEKAPKTSFSSIIAIDLGERVIATVCNSLDMRPIFMGREVRGIRRHFAWLRKKLGEKKLRKEIKRIGQKEQRKVDAYLHAISRKIVSVACTSDSIIVLGDLKGIRSAAKGKGKRFNHIVSNMPYYKLTQMIEYKAKWEGIPVIKVNERGTSKTCSICENEGKRPYQGLFRCNECGYQANADFNGAKNILERATEYISAAGAPVNVPITEPFLVSSEAPCDS